VAADCAPECLAAGIPAALAAHLASVALAAGERTPLAKLLRRIYRLPLCQILSVGLSVRVRFVCLSVYLFVPNSSVGLSVRVEFDCRSACSCQIRLFVCMFASNSSACLSVCLSICICCH
jgi:hypothetical protein